MSNKYEKLSGSGDIVVVQREGLQTPIAMDWFITVDGMPEDIIALEPSDIGITLFCSLRGKLTELLVETPTEAGAMEEYSPVDAMHELLSTAGVMVDSDGNFQLSDEVRASIDDLKEVESGVESNDVERFGNIEDLDAAVLDYYEDHEWE